MAWQVVIAGGGFGGFHTARQLERILPAQSAHITLINDSNFLLFTPLLPGAAGGTLEPRPVVVPLREQLSSTDLRIGTVTGADTSRNRISYRSRDGHSVELAYDQLVVALGSISRKPPIPGLAQHALNFKTLPEAMALRNRVLSNFETAEVVDDPAERARLLTFVFVGAGYSGVEGLAELQDFAVDTIELYPRCRLQGMRWLLVEAREQIMPEVDESLAAFVRNELRSRGIAVRTNTVVENLDGDQITLSGGEIVPTKTVVWTAGVQPNPDIERLGLPLNEGRIAVDRFLRVAGTENVWALGDAAGVPDPATGGKRFCPPTAQHAIRQGRTVAHNISTQLGSGQVRPFRYRTLGLFVDLGRKKAVASTVGIKWRGFPAWWLARTYHLAQMPGLKRKVHLITDWTAGLLFGRDSSQLGEFSFTGDEK